MRGEGRAFPCLFICLLDVYGIQVFVYSCVFLEKGCYESMVFVLVVTYVGFNSYG